VRDLELMIALGNATIRALSAAPGHRTHTAADGHVPAGQVAAPGAAASTGAWTPPIVRCVATSGDGVADLAAALDRHGDWVESTPDGQARRRERLGQEVREALREALIDAAASDLGPRIDAMAAEVEARSIDPYSATERLVEDFRRSRS
jgi:LAO/AO transport system kinase